MYLFGTLDPHPPTATPILGQSPKKKRVLIFTKKFGTLDPHLPIVWDKVPNKTVSLGTFPNREVPIHPLEQVFNISDDVDFSSNPQNVCVLSQ